MKTNANGALRVQAEAPVPTGEPTLAPSAREPERPVPDQSFSRLEEDRGAKALAYRDAKVTASHGADIPRGAGVGFIDPKSLHEKPMGPPLEVAAPTPVRNPSPFAAAAKVRERRAIEKASTRAFIEQSMDVQVKEGAAKRAAARSARLSDLPKVEALADLPSQFPELVAALAAGKGRIPLAWHPMGAGWESRLFVLDGQGIKSVKLSVDTDYEFNVPVYASPSKIRGGLLGRAVAWLRGITDRSVVRHADPELFREVLMRESLRLEEVEKTGVLPKSWTLSYKESRYLDWGEKRDGTLRLYTPPDHRDLQVARTR